MKQLMSGPLRVRRPEFHGWRIVRSGLFIQALHSGLVFNAFSLFSAELQEDFGWSHAVLGGAFALNRMESGLLGPLQGWMTDKWGPKVVLRVGAVIMAIGLFLFASLDNLWQFYVYYMLIAMGSSLAGFLSITVAIVTWFERRRSRALAYAQMGFAFGGLIAFGVGVSINGLGWRMTSLLAGFVVLAVVLPVTRHFERNPAAIGEHIDGIDPNEALPDNLPASTSTPIHFTAPEALRTRAFWFISLGHACALLVVGASMAHLALFLEEEQSLSGFHIAVVIGSLPIMMGVGQFLGGVLGDNMPKRPLLAGSMIGHGAGLAILAYATSPFMVWVFVVVHGIAWGVRGPLQSALRADYFGATDFGKIMGWSSLIVMSGMVIGPILAGVLRDSTGSFTLGFTILSVGAGLGSLFFWFAKPPPQPVRTDDPIPSPLDAVIDRKVPSRT